jgi:glycosyltransferase involved in cell wall biosynthesis
VAELLEAAVTALLHRGTGTVVRLLGAGGERFRARLVARDPALAGRLEAPGTLAPTALSAAIAGCDLMLQPFPDGVSSRRTSAMAAIAHGVALATTVGRLSEPLWEESGAVALAPADDPGALTATTARLLEDRAERCRLAAAGEALSRRCFALERTIESLRSGSAADPGGPPARVP